MGDLLLGIPLLKRLRTREPSATLSLFCRKGLGEFFTRYDLVDEVIEVDKSNAESRKASEAVLRARNWDWVISPHESIRTHRLVLSLRAKRKTGYRTFWNGLVFGQRVSRPMALPEALRQLALLSADDPIVRNALAEFGPHPDFKSFPELASLDARVLGEVPEWASMRVPRLHRIHMARHGDGVRHLSERAAALAEELRLRVDRGSGVAFLAPGSVWPTKMWTREGYAASARELLKMGFRVILTGAPQERELCESLAAETGARSVAGRTSLAESAELMALADVLICNDSGAMHVASACGVPSVAVFGPTTLHLGYRPWQSAARVVQTNLHCRPCGKHGAKVCPLGTHECMKSIPASSVLIEVGELFARGAGRGGL